MNLISYTMNYIWSTDSETKTLFPDGAITKAALAKMEVTNTHMVGYLPRKMTILNHTDFKISWTDGRFSRLNDFIVSNDYEKSFYLQMPLEQQITAYCMEDHPKLFFFEIKSETKSLFSTKLNSQTFLIDTDQIYHENFSPAELAPYYCDVFKVCASDFSESKISEISEYVRQKRKFNLIINGFRDQNSFFCNENTPKDIICNIAMQYYKALKSEIHEMQILK